MLLAVTTLCPILGGLILGCFPTRIPAKARRALAVGVSAATSLLIVTLIRAGAAAGPLIGYGPAFCLRFSLDGRGRALLMLIAALWPLSTLYATGYMAHEERESTFFMWYLIAYGAMVPFCCAGNLFTLYVFYECVTLTTLPLVWHRQDDESIRAARSYVRYSIGCAAFGFAALVALGAAGSLDFIPGGHAYAGIPEGTLNALYLTAFFGFGVKAAVFPFSAWLPRAGAAPTPVTALLHAVAVVNAGVFAVQRVTFEVMPARRLIGGWAQSVALAAATATIVYGAVMAVRERHVKRRLAYSTVSNLGYMLLGVALMSTAGDAAARLHMLCHSLTKIILFFCVGAVMALTGRESVAQMRGLGRRMPRVFVAFLIASLSLMGIPPLAGFSSKYLLITAAVEQGGPWALAGAGALVLSAILTAIYTMTVALPAWFMPLDGPGEAIADPDLRMLAPIWAILLMMLAAGLWPGALMSALRG